MKKLVVFGMLLSVGIAYGQTTGDNDYTIDMFPKTPDAAALSKFADIPPGNYTGVANFTIPLYTIDVDGITIPIELQYTTTGVKVGDIASRVGLGWALNAGPSLSQQVMGSMDKRPEKPFLTSSQVPQGAYLLFYIELNGFLKF